MLQKTPLRKCKDKLQPGKKKTFAEKIFVNLMPDKGIYQVLS